MASQVKRLLVTALRSIEQEALQSDETQARRPKSRQGKKTIAGHFDPVMAWQLKKLAVDRQTTVQSLLEESIVDLFEKYHLPRLG